MIRVDETDPVGELEPSFPYRDVTVRKNVDFKDYYDIESEIGRGKFGTVYRCKEKKTGLTLATKVVNTTRKEDRRDVEREVNIMRKLQHPRLIQLYDSIEYGKQIYVVLELIQGGELFERVIDDDFVLTERSCAVFMRQICEGIEFVHSQNILHLDMKPENILCLTKEGNRIKIIDFGLAREYDPKKKLQVLFGTPEFVAPEVVNFDQIGFGTDMWSIGVICYVLLSGLSPFMGDTDVETMANVTIAKYDFDHEAFADISDDAKDFIKCLLVKDISKRASARQCRDHRWLVVQKGTTSMTSSSSKIPHEQNPIVTTNSKKTSESTTIDNLNSELDVTKDNLRVFVERWREHPDSPYTIENHPSPERQASRETASLQGQSSPSPCGSICSAMSTSSLDNQLPGSSSRGGTVLELPDFGLAFERRASEGGKLLSDKNKGIDPASQILLAEEIIRLSEHLRSMASTTTTTSTTTIKSCNSSTKTTTRRHHHHHHREEEIVAVETNEINEKLANIAKQRKFNGTAFNDNYKNRDSNFTIERSCFKTKSSSSSSSKSSKTITPTTSNDDKNNEDYCSSDDEDNKTKFWPSNTGLRDMNLMPSWRRAKRRFGETCRDVPRIAKLQDLHKNMNLNEPTSTKNLLLQLIDEWSDVRRPSASRGCIGRKSISLDWCGEESVARKSINSLAEYFQSEQQQKLAGASSIR